MHVCCNVIKIHDINLVTVNIVAQGDGSVGETQNQFGEHAAAQVVQEAISFALQNHSVGLCPELLVLPRFQVSLSPVSQHRKAVPLATRSWEDIRALRLLWN
jgi:hypothetical protein